MTQELHEKHIMLIDAVNAAKTHHEHRAAELFLYGWRKGVRDAGGRVDLIAADHVQFERGHKERPMCCGMFLDWKEAL